MSVEDRARRTALAARAAPVTAAAVAAPQPKQSTPATTPGRNRMDPNGEPPVRLSLRNFHEDYHPSYQLIGVKFNGEERNDVEWYDREKGYLKTIYGQILEGLVEPYWRMRENRQGRRRRERWESGK